MIMYVLLSSQTSSKQTNRNFDVLGNNGFGAEDTNDNITGRDNHKQLMKSRVIQYNDQWPLSSNTYLTVLDDLDCEPFASSQPCWSLGCYAERDIPQ